MEQPSAPGGLLQTLCLKGKEHLHKGEPYERIVLPGDGFRHDPEDFAQANKTCIANSTH